MERGPECKFLETQRGNKGTGERKRETRRVNAKGKKKRVRNSGEGGAVDERCGATRREEKEDRKGRDQRGKKERRNREREREKEKERVRGTAEAKEG